MIVDKLVCLQNTISLLARSMDGQPTDDTSTDAVNLWPIIMIHEA